MGINILKKKTTCDEFSNTGWGTFYASVFVYCMFISGTMCVMWYLHILVLLKYISF